MEKGGNNTYFFIANCKEHFTHINITRDVSPAGILFVDSTLGGGGGERKHLIQKNQNKTKPKKKKNKPIELQWTALIKVTHEAYFLCFSSFDF